MTKYLFGCFLAAIIFVSFPISAQNYGLEEISMTAFSNEIKRTGKLDFKRTLNMSFKSNGYLKKLSVDEGEYFKKGKVLASLEVDELVENKNSTYAQLLQAKREVNRVSKLMEANLSSEQNLDDALTNVETTRAAYQVAFYNLEKAQVIAPFDGVVLARYTELGELQSAGKEILKVAAIENNWIVKVVLTGSEVGQVQLGQKVDVNLQHVGSVEGTISKIPVIANTDSNLFRIEILLPQLNLKSGIVAGQIAEVSISFLTDDLVFQVPIEALMGVDEAGKALLLTKLDTEELAEQSFDIYQLDNRYIYLSGEHGMQALNVVTLGWQQLAVGRN